MTVFEYRGRLLIVDCGVLFPDPDQPGVDLILPDFGYLDGRLDRVEALAACARSGLFDILAHPDLVKVWGGARPLPERDPRAFYEPAIAAIAAIRSQVARAVG